MSGIIAKERITAYRKFDPYQKFVSPEKIEQVVSDHFGYSIEEIGCKSRKTKICYCRHMMMYFLTNFTRLPLTYIGEKYGGRDHTTVISAKDKIKDMIETDDVVFYEVKAITEKLFDMDVKINSEENLVSVAAQAIHILNNLNNANKQWDDNPGFSARQNLRRWRQISEDFLKAISDREYSNNKVSLKIELTYDTSIQKEA
jgi:hypothetical protein